MKLVGEKIFIQCSKNKLEWSGYSPVQICHENFVHFSCQDKPCGCLDMPGNVPLHDVILSPDIRSSGTCTIEEYYLWRAILA